MKIRKLHIKNYKIFNDIELDFTDANGHTLDKVVLAGVNGCGKTAILEIILSICNNSLSRNFPKDENAFIGVEIELTVEERKEAQKYLDMYLKNYDSNYKQVERYDNPKGMVRTKLINLYNQLNNDNDYIINFDDNSTTILYTTLISIGIFERLYQSFKNITLVYLPAREVEHKEDKSTKVIHLSSDKNTMKELALKDIRNEIFKNEDIAPRKSKEKAIKRITKALNGLDLTTKLVDLDSEELIFESANGKKIKFEELSNGEQTLYFRAIYLSTLNPQNSIIMIDEPEESLHPTWQQKVLKLYQNIGENNQVIVATHSPHIIGSSNADEVFLLEIKGHEIEAEHPPYTKGHSIDYILEVMGANPRDTNVINTVDNYLALVRKGMHETEMGLKLKVEIDALNLDPNSAEMRRIDLSLKRFNAVGV